MGTANAGNMAATAPNWNTSPTAWLAKVKNSQFQTWSTTFMSPERRAITFPAGTESNHARLVLTTALMRPWCSVRPAFHAPMLKHSLEAVSAADSRSDTSP
jgi:hypothetical protein